ncbi:MAG: PIN domain-containing protein [Chloroflexi bacterium]|nr:PIN domain-containing protein [Chloroflexota bacterium]
MTAVLDTSVVVRYLMGDAPELAGQAVKIIDSEDSLQVTDVVLVETTHVLRTVYKVEREAIADALVAFVQKANISVVALDKGLVLQALLMCRPSGRVSFPDAMIWAAARGAGGKVVYSFDERFPTDGLEVRRA